MALGAGWPCLRLFPMLLPQSEWTATSETSGAASAAGGQPLRGLRLLLSRSCRGSHRRLLERPLGLVGPLRQEAAWYVDLRLSYFYPAVFEA